MTYTIVLPLFVFVCLFVCFYMSSTICIYSNTSFNKMKNCRVMSPTICISFCPQDQLQKIIFIEGPWYLILKEGWTDRKLMEMKLACRISCLITCFTKHANLFQLALAPPIEQCWNTSPCPCRNGTLLFRLPRCEELLISYAGQVIY